jgi:hypothetical protein
MLRTISSRAVLEPQLTNALRLHLKMELNTSITQQLMLPQVPTPSAKFACLTKLEHQWEATNQSPDTLSAKSSQTSQQSLDHGTGKLALRNAQHTNT